MFHIPKFESSFYFFLLKIDQDTLHKVKEKRCPYCNSSLDMAHFLRKPRGFPPGNFPNEFCIRYSLCCRKEGCRKRISPPSVRFLGRKVYLMIFILFTSSISRKYFRIIQKETGLSSHSLTRWRNFWKNEFLKTSFWKHAKARFMPPINEDQLPGSLLRRFDDSLYDAKILIFLAPIFSSSGKNNQMI